MIARCRARFAVRSPPRCSRWRVVLPEDAGMGATPQVREHRAAKVTKVPTLCSGDRVRRHRGVDPREVRGSVGPAAEC